MFLVWLWGEPFGKVHLQELGEDQVSGPGERRPGPDFRKSCCGQVGHGFRPPGFHVSGLTLGHWAGATSVSFTFCLQHLSQLRCLKNMCSQSKLGGCCFPLALIFFSFF